MSTNTLYTFIMRQKKNFEKKVEKEQKAIIIIKKTIKKNIAYGIQDKFLV